MGFPRGQWGFRPCMPMHLAQCRCQRQALPGVSAQSQPLAPLACSHRAPPAAAARPSAKVCADAGDRNLRHLPKPTPGRVPQASPSSPQGDDDPVPALRSRGAPRVLPPAVHDAGSSQAAGSDHVGGLPPPPPQQERLQRRLHAGSSCCAVCGAWHHGRGGNPPARPVGQLRLAAARAGRQPDGCGGPRGARAGAGGLEAEVRAHAPPAPGRSRHSACAPPPPGAGAAEPIVAAGAQHRSALPHGSDDWRRSKVPLSQVRRSPALCCPRVAALRWRRGWTLDYVLNTHHHSDHTGGNLALKAQTGCTIVGPRADRWGPLRVLRRCHVGRVRAPGRGGWPPPAAGCAAAPAGCAPAHRPPPGRLGHPSQGPHPGHRRGGRRRRRVQAGRDGVAGGPPLRCAAAAACARPARRWLVLAAQGGGQRALEVAGGRAVLGWPTCRRRPPAAQLHCLARPRRCPRSYHRRGPHPPTHPLGWRAGV
jgi:hypothetical protein